MKSSRTTTSSSESGIAMIGYLVFVVLLAVKVSLTEEFCIKVTEEVDHIMCPFFLLWLCIVALPSSITEISLSFISFVQSIWDGKKTKNTREAFFYHGFGVLLRCGRIWKYIYRQFCCILVLHARIVAGWNLFCALLLQSLVFWNGWDLRTSMNRIAIPFLEFSFCPCRHRLIYLNLT